MTRAILIIGAGVAGVAAAWSARREGRDVTLISRGAGASGFGGGAVDDAPWERIARASRDLGAPLPMREIAADVADFARTLDLWTLPAGGMERPRLATLAGRIRHARGHDRALLDLASLRDTRVLVPRVNRAGWDADFLAAALSDDPFARSRSLRFEASDTPVLRFRDEERIADGDLAARHDDEERITWLADRLREALARLAARGPVPGAVLLGPWLGASSPRAALVSSRAGILVGEALMGAGSPAGLRFEAARDRVLQSAGVRVVRDRATSVDLSDGNVVVSLERDATPLVGDAVVLAVGGVAGGGVVYAPPESLAVDGFPPRASVPFVLSLKADVGLAGDDGPLDVTSSLQGPELDLTAWPSGDRLGVLEAAGVRCVGVRAGAHIVAAGDAIAGRSRTLLEAVASGVRAGREA